jgi:cellulase
MSNDLSGFIEPAAFGTSDIACHKSAKSTSVSIPVKAGDSVKLQWDTWPDSHHGPVIDYLAKVGSHSPSNAPGSLSFFKIAESGLISGSSPPGTWASDTLISSSHSFHVEANIY